MKTTVNGYKLARIHPHMGELERWTVRNVVDHYYGIIVKAVYKGHAGAHKPIVFWFIFMELRYGYRRFSDIKVFNTRRDAVMGLARRVEK